MLFHGTTWSSWGKIAQIALMSETHARGHGRLHLHLARKTRYVKSASEVVLEVDTSALFKVARGLKAEVFANEKAVCDSRLCFIEIYIVVSLSIYYIPQDLSLYFTRLFSYFPLVFNRFEQLPVLLLVFRPHA